MPARKQKVEQRAEAEHVHRDAHGPTQELLGRGERRRQGGTGHLAGRGKGGDVLRHEPCDAEVEELHLSLGVDEHVGRLDIAVHDQIGVRVNDRIRHLQEEDEAFVDGEAVVVGVAIDRDAVHVLQHQIGLPGLGNPGVEQAGDVRM